MTRGRVKKWPGTPHNAFALFALAGFSLWAPVARQHKFRPSSCRHAAFRAGGGSEVHGKAPPVLGLAGLSSSRGVGKLLHTPHAPTFADMSVRIRTRGRVPINRRLLSMSA